MIKISAIVITKNAEEMIADCLDSLSFCEEIIIVDNKSEDRTCEIAEKMGARVVEHSSHDFSEMRNMGMRKAMGEWLLYIDTDERVTAALAADIKYQISRLPAERANISPAGLPRQVKAGEAGKYTAFRVKRKNFYFGNHEWPYIERLERLFRKDKLEGWYGKLHESPKFKGEIGELDGYLCHYTRRNLSAMLEKTIEWSKIEAELRFNSGHPKMTWWRFPRVMLTAFLDYYIKQGGWKVGVVGLIESMYQSYSIFITYARLWEMQEKLKIKN